MSMKSIPPSTPLLYTSKTGVYRGLPIFLIFGSKTDCVYSLKPPQLVHVPTINVLSINIKKLISFFLMKLSIFKAEKILCI